MHYLVLFCLAVAGTSIGLNPDTAEPVALFAATTTITCTVLTIFCLGKDFGAWRAARRRQRNTRKLDNLIQATIAAEQH